MLEAWSPSDNVSEVMGDRAVAKGERHKQAEPSSDPEDSHKGSMPAVLTPTVQMVEPRSFLMANTA